MAGSIEKTESVLPGFTKEASLKIKQASRESACACVQVQVGSATAHTGNFASELLHHDPLKIPVWVLQASGLCPGAKTLTLVCP